MSKKAKNNIKAYLFMAPALIVIGIFVFLPIVGSLPLMFTNYSALGETKFIGLDNFKRLFADPVFWKSLKNSIVFVIVVPIIQILSMMLAVLVNRKIAGIAIFRTLFYIPVVTSMVAVSIMWGFLFDPSGIVNTFLMDKGLIAHPIGFLSDAHLAMPSLMFITIWQGLGYYMMLYLSGLQSVPADLQEAARLDGANGRQVFFKVDVPMLKPYIWFCSLNSVISAVGVFDVVYVLTKGGPADATNVINYYSYTKAFQDYDFGYASAVGAVQAIITTLVSIVIFVYGRKGGGMTYDS